MVVDTESEKFLIHSSRELLAGDISQMVQEGANDYVLNVMSVLL